MSAEPKTKMRHFLFNPRLQNAEELERLFVARRDTFARLYEEIASQESHIVPRHLLIIGQRGMGKTTMLMRLALELQKEQNGFLPLTFWEEQHVEVDRLSVFWLNCLDSLADALQLNGENELVHTIDRTVKDLEAIQDEEDKARTAADALAEVAKKLGRRLVLFIDNFNLLLQKLKRHDHVLRGFFTRHGAPIIVGAGICPPASLNDYDAAFYDGFSTTLLDRLTLEELKSMILRLSEDKGEPEAARNMLRHRPRIAALRDLSGGNPRTSLLIYRLCAKGLTEDIYKDLEILLDETTPLFQSRFEQLSEQGQKLVSRLAKHWKPATAEQITQMTEFPRGTVSPLLGRLEADGIVEKTQLYDPNRPESPRGGLSKKPGYQLAERFFNIWITMRSASRRERSGIECLSRFLELLFSREELGEEAGRLSICGPQNWNQAVLAQALSQTVEDGFLATLASTKLLDLTKRGEGRLEDFLDPKEIPDHLHWWVETKDALRKSVPTGASIDPEAFADLVTGSFSIVVPRGFARSVVQDARDGKKLSIELILAEIYDETARIEALIGTESAQWLRKRIGSGHLISLLEPSAIESAIKDCHLAGALSILGEIASENHLDLAETAYRKAVAADEKLPQAWAQLGHVCYKQRKFNVAKEAFTNAIELGYESAAVFASYGKLFALEFGDMPEAEKWMRKAAELDPRNAQIAHNLGATLMFQAGKEKALLAVAEFKREAALDPTNPKPWQLIGDIKAEHFGEIAEAEMHYRRAISMTEKSPESRTRLGELLLYKKNEVDAAEEQFRKAIRDGSTLSGTWIGLAMILAIKEKLDEAESAFKLAMEKDDPAWAWTSYGTFLNHHYGRVNDAEKCHEKAIEINDKCGLAWFNMGALAIQSAGKEDFAKKCFENALAINSQDKNALSSLGNLEFDHYQNVNAAESHYKAALEVDPAFDMNRHNYAFLLRDGLGKADEAKKLLEGIKQPESWKDTQALHRVLFAAHDKNWGIATAELKVALAAVEGEHPPKNTLDDWCRASAVLLNLGYGKPLLEFLIQEGADVRMLPWFAALEAHVVGDRRMILNIPAEARNAADKLFDQISKRLPLLAVCKNG